jgi:hypothetical protein
MVQQWFFLISREPPDSTSFTTNRVLRRKSTILETPGSGVALKSGPAFAGSPQTFADAFPILVVETTGDRSMLLQPQPRLSFRAGEKANGRVIAVNDAKQYQQMDGLQYSSR